MRTLRTTIVILLFLSLLALSLVGALTLYATPERVTARGRQPCSSHILGCERNFLAMWN